MISMQGAGQMQNMKLMKDRMADMKTQADEMGKTVETMKRMYDLMTQLVGVTDDMVGQMNDLQVTIHELRDHIADFDDFFRPIRNYFYWEPHCYNIPMCHSIRSLFDALDGVSEMTDSMDGIDRQRARAQFADAADGRPVRSDDRARWKACRR